MTNDILLIRHQKKLALYFALFVLFSLWFAQGVFMISNYLTQNLRLVNKIESRVEGIKNILSNKREYLEKLQSNDATLKRVIDKSLQWVTIYENNSRILGNIDTSAFSRDQKLIYSQYNLYYQTNFLLGVNQYYIVIESPNEYSYIHLVKELSWFLLFTLPFTILFYFLGSIFVGKNLKPIDETIQSLEDFSSNLNHEIKTPLSEIISTLSLTKRTKDGYEEAIDQSLHSAAKITKILDSMMGLIRLVDASYKKERINLVPSLRDIIREFQSLAEKNKIEIKTKFQTERYMIRVNRVHLEICVGNIMKNAIKYSSPQSQIYVNFEEEKLVIRDSGIGISKENLSNIFDRYFRENYIHQEWHGLGLALVKKIVDLNKWNISITSDKDIGTAVTISFS